MMAGRSGITLCRVLANFAYRPARVSQRGIKSYVRPVLQTFKKRQEKYIEQIGEEEYMRRNKRSNFAEWNYSAEIFAFGKRLHEEFLPELLVQAFTHRSYIIEEEMKMKELGIENPNIGLKDNNSLASEGEKIISEYVTSYVAHFFPRFPLEGIEAVHEYLTKEETLCYISKNLGTTFLILSSDYPVESFTYAKTLKAIVGALKESSGIKRSRLFVRDFIVTQLAQRDINDFLDIKNPLKVLSEILAKDGREVPEPRILCQSATNTILANYHVGIYCSKQLIGQCSGESIDIAVEMAAFDALKRLFHTVDSCSPMTFDFDLEPGAIKNLKLSDWNSAAFEKS